MDTYIHPQMEIDTPPTSCAHSLKRISPNVEASQTDTHQLMNKHCRTWLSDQKKEITENPRLYMILQMSQKEKEVKAQRPDSVIFKCLEEAGPSRQKGARGSQQPREVGNASSMGIRWRNVFE